MNKLLKNLIIACTCTVFIMALSACGETAEQPQKLQLELEANSSTGYFWTVSDSEIFQIEDEYVEAEQEGDEMMVGVPGTMKYVLTAEKPGQETLEFVYAQGDIVETCIRYSFKVNDDLTVEFLEKEIITPKNALKVDYPDPEVIK